MIILIGPSVRNFRVALQCWIDSDSSRLALKSSHVLIVVERIQTILEPYLFLAFLKQSVHCCVLQLFVSSWNVGSE